MIPIAALIEEPVQGAWVADTTTAEVPTGTFEAGDASWVGTIASPGAVLDGSRYRCRIVGGNGRLGLPLAAKNYSGAVAWSVIAADIIRESGETAGAITITGSGSYYERIPGMTSGQALADLCSAASCTWWIGRDGKLNVAASRPVSVVDETHANRIAYDNDGTITLNVTKASDVNPGQTLDGQSLQALRWSLVPEHLTVECGLSNITLPDRRNRFYEKTYSAKVHQQNSDGSVDVIAAGLFAMSNVKLLAGWPGSRITVKPGELVSVGFFNGNRSLPYAVAGEQGGAGRPLSLLDDAVSVALPPFSFVGTVSGAPASGVMTALVAQTLGKITGPGSQRVKSE